MMKQGNQLENSGNILGVGKHGRLSHLAHCAALSAKQISSQAW